MIPAITIFSIVEYLKQLNIHRLKKIRESGFGFREIMLSTDYGPVSLFYNYKTQSLIISTARISPPLFQHPIIKLMNKELSNGIIEEITIPNFERILFLKIRKRKKFTLIVEIFGKGNTILTDADNKIIYLEHSIKTKYRTLSVGEIYETPISDKISLQKILDENGLEILKHYLIGKSFSEVYKVINLDKYTIKEAMYRTGFNGDYKNKVMEEDSIIALYSKLKEIINEAESCRYFSIIKNRPIVLLPFRVHFSEDIKTFSNIIDACNNYLEQILKDVSLNLFKSIEISKLKKQLQNLVKKQELLKSELSLLEEFVPTLYTRINELILLFNKVAHGEKVNYKVNKHDKVIYLPVEKDLTIKIRYDLPPIKAINMLYESEIKPRKRGLEKLQKKINELEKYLSEEKLYIPKEKIKLEYKSLIKKEWYEAYRWFYTSNGLLALGGRDVRSNRKLIKKHLDDNDIVFHADYYGSPFVILKNGRKADEIDISETAIFTASYSRAWRDGLSTLDVYYVYPDQVSEKTPSGEYLKRGSFMIYGKKNYIRKVPLGLCLSFDKQLKKLVIGPCSSIVKKDIISKVYLIYPGVKTKGETVKKIAESIVGIIMDETGLELSMEYLINTINSILPSGKFNIKITLKNFLVE